MSIGFIEINFFYEIILPYNRTNILENGFIITVVTILKIRHTDIPEDDTANRSKSTQRKTAD